MKTGHSNNLREPLEPGFDLKNRPHCEPFQLGQGVAFILEPETSCLIKEPRLVL